MPHESHMIGYRCIACSAEQGAEFKGFQCPACGGNLDIRYDYRAIAKQLDGRFRGKKTGLFRYQPLLPVREPEPGFPLRVGATPLYRADRLAARLGLEQLFLKDDSLNPSASLKDRASTIAMCRAMETGAKVVAAASTGNAGSSTACLSAALGLPAVVFVPESAPPAKLTQLLAYGTRVLAVKGSYDDAYDLCSAVCERFGWFNRSTGFNPFTREGKKTCAFELWEDLGCRVPDRVIVPTGDGNIISGMWKGWKDLKSVGLVDRLPKIDCAQSDGSAAISHTVNRLRRSAADPEWSEVSVDAVSADTKADSISVDRPRDGLAAVRAVIESGGEAVAVPDKSILEAIGQLARLAGIYAEPAAAASWAALARMKQAGRVHREEQVVCLVTGSGLKDARSAAEAVGEPELIEPCVEAVERCLERES